MEALKTLFKNNIVAFGILISFAWVVSSFVLASGLANINKKNGISVTGTAEQIVQSDAGKWVFSITQPANQDQYSYVSKNVREDGEAAVKYLIKNGVDQKQITVSPIASSVVCQSQNQVMYDGNGKQQCSGFFTYSIKETITVDSDDVEKIKDLSLHGESALTDLGVQIQTVSVDFFYTKLSDLRVELLSQASKNAKERAAAIAKSTGDSIGSVKDASQGVFQVTQKNSTDISDYGSYDTSTIEKKVTAIVRASFEVK
jgi:hypothetical protein